MSNKLKNIILLSTFVISFLMHFQHFSKDLMSIHVWRQTQTQSTTINFYEGDMNIFTPQRNDRGDTEGIFRMEFPLMQWLIACLYKVFGNYLIVSRCFMFVIGIFSVLGMYKLLNELFSNTTLSVMGAWAFNFSPSFYYYTINPLPDNLALCCSIWGLAMFFGWYTNKKIINLILCGLLLSIGALCKLPFIIYFIAPIVYFLSQIFEKGLNGRVLAEFFSVMSFSVLPIMWYVKVIPQWEGNPIVKGMFDSKESISKLLDYYQHNLVSTLPELLLNYGSLIFFIAGFYFLIKKRTYTDPRFVIIISLCTLATVFYLFEANAIAKIHDYYLFPFYPMLFMLVSYGAYNLFKSGKKFNRYLTIGLIIILPFTCYLRMQNRWNPNAPGFNKDLLDYKIELQNAVPNDALVVAGNDESHFIFFYYIDKKGWVYHNDNLSSDNLKIMIEKGAEYLYTDSENLFRDKEIEFYLDKLILEKGTIRIYKLKSLL